MTWPRVARVALALTVVGLFLTAQAQIWTAPPAYDAGGRPLNAVLAALLILPLLLARRWPLPVLFVVLGAASADYALGGGLGQAWFSLLVAVYALGAYGSTRASGLGLAVTAGLVLAVDIPRLQGGEPVEDVVPGWFILGATWGLGRWIRHRQAELAGLSSHARALEHDRDEATRAAVAYERARIARELHDLVAHSMAVIVLQSQAAQRVASTDLDAARRALEAIETTGREGLAELRRLLDILLVEVDADELEPRPSLAHLPLLVDRVRDTGLPVEVSVTGEPRALPPGVDVSAYRIVQEALTNTLKHAGRTTAEVGVTYLPDGVELCVSDRGAPGATGTSGTGRGLIGMRERAHLYGGTVEAGPVATGGFQVRAVLPTGGAS